MNTFEFNLLNSRPVDGSINITIVSMVVSDASEQNYLKSIKHVVIGYLVRKQKNPETVKYGDVTGTGSLQPDACDRAYSAGQDGG
jgi:hypothetical protein